jgi:hypothetical protein
MHSFVHGLYSPNPTAPHHESTPLNPSHQRSISMRHHHWPSHLFDTVGSQRGSTEVLYAMEEGGGGLRLACALRLAVSRLSPENESKAVVRPSHPPSHPPALLYRYTPVPPTQHELTPAPQDPVGISNPRFSCTSVMLCGVRSASLFMSRCRV